MLEYFLGWNFQQSEGVMQPSWTSPIPQAMQQHRGSQAHKPKPADASDAGEHASADKPAVNTQPDQASRDGK